MSKYGKVMKRKEYLKQQKLENRRRAMEKKERMSSVKDIKDERSNLDTFIQWCDECTNGQLFYYEGILSILGSDGIDLNENRVGDAPINNPVAVDMELETEGYYESDKVMTCVEDGGFDYTAPKVHYLEWFNKKFHTDYRI